MNPIYEPRGKALEYAPLACNLFSGCSHKCAYCYCPAIMHTTLDKWSEKPEPRKDVITCLERQLSKNSFSGKRVLLSFMSDPYHSEDAAKITRQALDLFELHGVSVDVLTKNPSNAILDYDIFMRNDWRIATTAVFVSDEMRESFEPGAPSVISRFEAIRKAHDLGIKTWLSIEPILDHNEALRVIELFAGCVDLVKIGRWNHDKRASEIDWCRVIDESSLLMRKLNVSYYVKNDLFVFASEITRGFGQTWQAKK